MKVSGLRLRSAVLVSAMALVAGACGGSDEAATTTAAPVAVETAAPAPEPVVTDAPVVEETTAVTDAPVVEETTAVTDAPAASMLVDNGPCDAALPTVDVAISTSFDSPALQLKQQVTATEASVAAFNGRGGIGGRCMKLTTCDDKGDPNIATDCARSIIESSVVATLNDTTSVGDAAVSELYIAADMARVGQSPGTVDLNSPVSFNLGGGGLGTTFMMLAPLFDAGITKIAAIHVDLPAFAGAIGLLETIIVANGAELVKAIPVPGGSTNFDQFVLAAEDAGAEGVFMPLGSELASQVVKAASELDSEMLFTSSLGSFNTDEVAALGEFGKTLKFNAEMPAINASTEEFPALVPMLEDFAAFGDDALAPGKIKSSAMRSWLATYAFVTIMSAGDTENITRESVIAAMRAAKDVDMLGLTPPWTPDKPSTGAFSRISNPVYYTAQFDGEKFVMDAETSSLQELLKSGGLG